MEYVRIGCNSCYACVCICVTLFHLCEFVLILSLCVYLGYFIELKKGSYWEKKIVLQFVFPLVWISITSLVCRICVNIFLVCVFVLRNLCYFIELKKVRKSDITGAGYLPDCAAHRFVIRTRNPQKIIFFCGETGASRHHGVLSPSGGVLLCYWRFWGGGLKIWEAVYVSERS